MFPDCRHQIATRLDIMPGQIALIWVDLIQVGGDVVLVIYDHVRKLPKLSQFQADSLTDMELNLANKWIGIVACSADPDATTPV